MSRAGGSGRPLVICGVDSIGLFHDDIKRVREGIDADIVVAALHDHESPDTMGLWGPAQGKSGISETYNTFVVNQIRSAVKSAIGSLQPARAKLAKTHDRSSTPSSTTTARPSCTTAK